MGRLMHPWHRDVENLLEARGIKVDSKFVVATMVHWELCEYEEAVEHYVNALELLCVHIPLPSHWHY